MKLTPVDLSFLGEWKFVQGVGYYAHKEACIMSALFLAVKIAEGKVTLDQVLVEKYDPPSKALGEYDHVSCVSKTLRDAVVERNDGFNSDDARKEWALKMLPRLLGTALGDTFEKKLRQALSAFRSKRPAVPEEDRADQSIWNKRLDEDIEFLITTINAEKEKRAATNAKRRATMAEKKMRGVPPLQ
jgi:hypothetical protein